MNNTENFKKDFKQLLMEAECSPFKQSRKHLQFGPMIAYIRIGERLILMSHDSNHLMTNCVQLASLNIPKKKMQHKGLFTQMLAIILELTDLPIYVESILNIEFGNALLRRGFTKVHQESYFIIPDLILFR